MIDVVIVALLAVIIIIQIAVMLRKKPEEDISSRIKDMGDMIYSGQKNMNEAVAQRVEILSKGVLERQEEFRKNLESSEIRQEERFKTFSSETEQKLENIRHTSVSYTHLDVYKRQSDCSFILQKVLNAAYVLPCEQVSENSTESSTETKTEVTTEESRHIKIEIGAKSFDATLYDNAAADILIKQLPLSIEMDELNGNEKYYYFSDISFPTDSQRVGTINSGDLMLYGNDCLVLFYESFSTPYSYTPLGYVDDPMGLSEAVGNGNITVSFNISE